MQNKQRDHVTTTSKCSSTGDSAVCDVLELNLTDVAAQAVMLSEITST